MPTYDYTAVQARLDKWGLLPLLERAHQTRLTRDGAITYARAILGRKAHVRVKRIRRSWAHADGSISLSCDSARSVRLRCVLHECAHVLNDRKGSKLSDESHGEAFCRTYARLLREVM